MNNGIDPPDRRLETVVTRQVVDQEPPPRDRRWSSTQQENVMPPRVRQGGHASAYETASSRDQDSQGRSSSASQLFLSSR